MVLVREMSQFEFVYNAVYNQLQNIKTVTFLFPFESATGLILGIY